VRSHNIRAIAGIAALEARPLSQFENNHLLFSQIDLNTHRVLFSSFKERLSFSPLPLFSPSHLLPFGMFSLSIATAFRQWIPKFK
jgi:hypothetical protein